MSVVSMIGGLTYGLTKNAIKNGTLRFYEKWQWAGGENGTAVIEGV